MAPVFFSWKDLQDAEVEAKFMRNLLAMIKASLATQSANAGNFANISNMDSKSEESRLLVQARENPKTRKPGANMGSWFSSQMIAVGDWFMSCWAYCICVSYVGNSKTLAWNSLKSLSHLKAGIYDSEYDELHEFKKQIASIWDITRHDSEHQAALHIK